MPDPYAPPPEPPVKMQHCHECDGTGWIVRPYSFFDRLTNLIVAIAIITVLSLACYGFGSVLEDWRAGRIQKQLHQSN